MIKFCVQREVLLKQVEERGKNNDETKKAQQKCSPNTCYIIVVIIILNLMGQVRF